MLQKHFHRFGISMAGGPVKGRPVVHAALVRIGASHEQEVKNLQSIGPFGGKCGEESRKAGVVHVVRIGSESDQRLDEGNRTPVDCVFERVAQAQFMGHRLVEPASRASQSR